MKDLKLKHQLLQAELISQRNKKEQFIKSINKKINELKLDIKEMDGDLAFNPDIQFLQQTAIEAAKKQIELLEWVIEKGE